MRADDGTRLEQHLEKLDELREHEPGETADDDPAWTVFLEENHQDLSGFWSRQGNEYLFCNDNFTHERVLTALRSRNGEAMTTHDVIAAMFRTLEEGRVDDHAVATVAGSLWSLPCHVV
jgi:hypothetical protein